MVINHNLSAMYASRIENINSKNLQNTMEKLSSGERINSAKDGAAELAVSERMRSQIRGLNQASRNIGNGVSFIQATEGFLQETTDILQRIRELAVQSADGIWDDESRLMIQVEVSQLIQEVDRIASTAQFNGMNILTGRFSEGGVNAEGIRFHIGANVDQNISIQIGKMDATSLGLRGSQEGAEQITVADQESSNMTIATVDEALKVVLQQRANLGAVMNRAEMAQKGIDIATENLTASESRIRDTDMAKDIVELTRQNILQNAGVAMLGQANSQAQNVLALLK